MAILEQPHAEDSAPDTPVIVSTEGDRIAAVDAIRQALKINGVHTDFDPDFHGTYGLDFVVIRIRGVHAHVNLGVQVTLNPDHPETQDAFLNTSRRGIAHKHIYLELDPGTVSTGAVPVAISACTAFLFDRRYQHFKAIGLRVSEDCTFHYFDVEESARRLKRQSSLPEQSVGQEMSGNIIAYFTDKGFGFIEAEKDHKFFFHIANVIDDELRVQLPSYQPGDDIPVVFKHGGHDGKKYPKALEVAYDTEEYEEEEEEEEEEEFEDEEY